MLRDWDRLTLKTECGPELLALRTTFCGSLCGVARAISGLIQEGQVGLKSLNHDRLWRPDAPGSRRKAVADARRRVDREAFEAALIVDPRKREWTGLQLDRAGLGRLLPAL